MERAHGVNLTVYLKVGLRVIISYRTPQVGRPFEQQLNGFTAIVEHRVLGLIVYQRASVVFHIPSHGIA